MEEKEDGIKTVAKVTSLAGAGAGAGVAIAAIASAPLLIPALIGGGIACIGGAIYAGVKKNK